MREIHAFCVKIYRRSKKGRLGKRFYGETGAGIIAANLRRNCVDTLIALIKSIQTVNPKKTETTL